jgi:SAM-dependent methyltransferase
MFFDDVRKDFYAKAINQQVTKDSVVLDLGAGLGLHGFMAIESGARKSYFVEPASIIEITKLIVEANNLSEKAECIRGTIEEVELPEKVDCIISVFTGNFLLTEDLLPSLFYARDHFLRPGGTLIPNRAMMEVVPVSAQAYYAKHIDCWSDTAIDTNFDLVRKFAVNTLYHDDTNSRKQEFLAEPVKLLDLDFMTATEAACRNRVEIRITQNGLCHGWLGWFRTRLGEHWLSTSPLEEQMHWRQVFLPLSQPIQVKKGDTMEFELNRPDYSEWTWTVDYADVRQRQSTFNSRVVSPKELLNLSNNYKAILTDRGLATLNILKQMDGTQNTSSIVKHLLETNPHLFKAQLPAEQFIKRLIQRYA